MKQQLIAEYNYHLVLNTEQPSFDVWLKWRNMQAIKTMQALDVCV